MSYKHPLATKNGAKSLACFGLSSARLGVKHMVNIIHLKAGPLVLGVISDASVTYYSGKSAPNYPLPAIPTEVHIDSECVGIFEWHGPEITGNTLRVVFEVERYHYQG